VFTAFAGVVQACENCSLASTCDKTSQRSRAHQRAIVAKTSSAAAYASRARWHIHCFHLVITSCPNEALVAICLNVAARAQKVNLL